MERATVVINSRSGLHARPASILAGAAKSFASNITLQNNDRTANCKSLLSILSLLAKFGDSVDIFVEGEDEEEAVRTMKALFEERLKHED